jgi:hypothetical protein
MTESKSPSSSQTPQHKSMGGIEVLVRFVWLAFGPALLFVLTFKIGQSARVSALDALFWAVVVVMVLLRYIDIARLGGMTSNCEPATPGDWRRYAVGVLVVAAALWALAHTLLIDFMG